MSFIYTHRNCSRFLTDKQKALSPCGLQRKTEIIGSQCQNWEKRSTETQNRTSDLVRVQGWASCRKGVKITYAFVSECKRVAVCIWNVPCRLMSECSSPVCRPVLKAEGLGLASRSRSVGGGLDCPWLWSTVSASWSMPGGERLPFHPYRQSSSHLQTLSLHKRKTIQKIVIQNKTSHF